MNNFYLINNNFTKYKKNYLKKRTCPICKSSKNTLINEFKKYQFFTDSSVPKKTDIKNVQCNKCFFIFQNPAYTREALSKLFAEATLSYGNTVKSKQDQIRWFKNNNLIWENSSILDVGCWDGDFLNYFPDYVKKYGVDIDKNIIKESLKKNKKLNLFYGDFEYFKTKKKFDIISILHVLEHLRNPIKVLKNLRNLLKDSGKLVVEVPVLENQKTNSIDGFVTIQHMSHFSKTSLFNMLTLSGWNVEKYLFVKSYNAIRVICIKSHNVNKKIDLNKNDVSKIKKIQKDLSKKIAKINSKINKFKLNENNYLLGGGMHLELVHNLTELFSKNHKKFKIIDNDKSKQNKTWRGIPIYGKEILKNDKKLNHKKFIICSYAYQNEIYKSLKDLKIKDKNILKFYDKIIVY